MKIKTIKERNKGQLQIQQMAFVLLALMVFFIIVALFYFSVRLSTLRTDAALANENDAKELVKKIASSPEFAFNTLKTSECPYCIDMDKVILIKDEPEYKNFWKLDYLAIEQIYPAQKGGECTQEKYRNNACNFTTILKTKPDYGTPVDAFVALCRWKTDSGFNGGGNTYCVLGKIYAAGEGISPPSAGTTSGGTP